MSRRKLTPESVFALCDEIWLSGREPTYLDITSTLGGSNETARPLLHAWQERPRPARIPMPEAIATQARVVLQLAWARALREAELSLEAARREAGAELEATKRMLQAQIDQTEAVALQLRSEREQVEQLRDQMAQMKLRLEQVGRLEERLREATQANEALLAENQRLHLNVERVGAEARTLREVLGVKTAQGSASEGREDLEGQQAASHET